MYRIPYFFSLEYTVDLSVHVNIIFFSDYNHILFYKSKFLQLKIVLNLILKHL